MDSSVFKSLVVYDLILRKPICVYRLGRAVLKAHCVELSIPPPNLLGIEQGTLIFPKMIIINITAAAFPTKVGLT